MQSQGVSEWTIDEMRHALHDKGTLLQQIWQDDGVQRHERLRYFQMTSHARFRILA